MIWNSEQFGPFKCFKCVQLCYDMFWWEFGIWMSFHGSPDWDLTSQDASEIQFREEPQSGGTTCLAAISMGHVVSSRYSWRRTMWIGEVPWAPFFWEFLPQHQIPSHKLKEFSVNRILVRKRCWVLLHPRHLALLTHVTTGEGTSLSPLLCQLWQFPVANRCKIPNKSPNYYNILQHMY